MNNTVGTLVKRSSQNLSEPIEYKKNLPLNKPSITLAEIAEASFDEISSVNTNRHKSFEEKIEEDSLRYSIYFSKSYLQCFKIDHYVLNQMANLKEVGQISIDTQNQINHLLKTAKLSESRVIKILQNFSLDDLFLLKKLLKIWQQEKKLEHDLFKVEQNSFDDGKNQCSNESDNFNLYLKEIESWSIVFDRYKRFDSYLSNEIDIREGYKSVRPDMLQTPEHHYLNC